METSVHYQFKTYKVLDADIQELERSDNPFATVIEVVQTALKKGTIPDEKLFDLKVDLVKKLLQRRFPKEKIRTLLRFLKLYIRFENKELNHTFDQKLDEITHQKTTMGLKEFVLDRERRVGRKEGISQGMAIKEREDKINFTKSLLLQTDFSDEKIANLVGVAISFVQEINASMA